MIVDGFGAVAGVASHVELGCGYGDSMRVARAFLGTATESRQEVGQQ
jgi:hypothetical protein